MDCWQLVALESDFVQCLQKNYGLMLSQLARKHRTDGTLSRLETKISDISCISKNVGWNGVHRLTDQTYWYVMKEMADKHT
uniref:Uncharacterized protein n=1 Tax=Romanomermis culicivorax TaxID=13658 RepID=A0A915LBI0_ROMCU